MNRNFFLLLLIISIFSFAVFLLYFKETNLHQAALHLGIFSIAMYFLWNNNLKTTLKEIGFPGSFWATAKYFVLGLILVFAALLALGLISLYLGMNDQQKVAEKITGLPIYVLFLAVLVAPITEELLFRGYLTRKYGILPSSIAFGLLHFAYGSSVEIAGTFLIGMILAFIFMKSKSITPCILIHMAYNAFSISVLLLTRSMV